MDKKVTKAVVLPQGCFGIPHNCSTCVYANWRDKDSDGRVHCSGGYGGYNFSENRNGCIHWEGK